MKNKNYDSGQVWALCPGCRQSPQSLARLVAGGSTVVVSVGDGVGDREGVADGERAWEGEESCTDSLGRGQVVSFK